MPSFTTANTPRTPFGKNQYLRSTRGLGFESFTLADGTVPERTIDGFTEKYLQPGTVMAKITSGPDAGKIGPYEAGDASAEIVTIARTGTVTGGTFTLSVAGETTAAIAYNATAAQVQAALELLDAIDPGELTVTGGPGGTADLVITWNSRGNKPNITLTGSVTGGGSYAATVTPGTDGGVGAATDGRESTANIVGILETFLPWQTKYRDVEVSVLYRGAVVQAWCMEMGAADAFVPLTNGTRDAMLADPRLSITFH
jgi:hypothetical protein